MKLKNIPPAVMGVGAACAVMAMIIIGAVLADWAGVESLHERCEKLGGVYVFRAHTCFKPEAIIKVAP